MAESSAMNSDNKVEQSDAKSAEVTSIKKELDVLVKAELLECVVCVARSHECFDIYCATTAASGASLHQFLCKFTHVDLSTAQNCSKFICKSCFDLINVLEQAELEYVKLKETFEAIISKNPLFEVSFTQQLNVDGVKTEEYLSRDYIVSEDSEDEPLARAKKKRHRKVVKKKKKLVSATSKRKVSKNNHDDGSWECSECNAHGETGGAIAETAHKLAMHTLTVEAAVLRNVKTEDSADVSQSPEYSNGFDNCLEIEFGNFNDDNSSGATDDYNNGNTQISKEGKHLATRPKIIKSLPIQKRKKKATKVMHQCDQCSARYSSLSRLEQHKQKHDGSKPPYICEVCGAHYKHKRACDIHIAMHKGISDWKCEECNKLFPSKNALQRHNNIHTGKLNYQCDLCGKSFIHTSSFKMHKLSHSGVKPHACDVCGLALMTRSHLKRHKRIHSGEKRYECAVCGKRFSERYNMMAHSKSHDALEPRSAAEPRRRLFRCTFCPERFERRYMLERHVSAAHGRTLERPPPTPRNTMSKLLKAQAHARVPSDPAPAPPRPAAEADTKDDGSSESRATPITPQKLIAQLSSSGSAIAASSWSGAYAAEFGLRGDFPH